MNFCRPALGMQFFETQCIMFISMLILILSLSLCLLLSVWTQKGPIYHCRYRSHQDCHHGACLIASTRADFIISLVLSSSTTRCRSLAFTCSSRTSSSSWSFICCLCFWRDSLHARLFLRRRSRYCTCRPPEDEVASQAFRLAG